MDSSSLHEIAAVYGGVSTHIYIAFPHPSIGDGLSFQDLHVGHKYLFIATSQSVGASFWSGLHVIFS